MDDDEFEAQLAGIRAGDREALGWLFVHFKADVERCFRRRPAEERADLVQDVFVTALVRLPTFQGEREAVLRAWLRSIAFHRWHHLWEAEQVRRRHQAAPLELLLDLNPNHSAFRDSSPDPCSRAVASESVQGLLGQLTRRQAEVVSAHVLEGLSTQDIADLWGVPRERVRGLYKRGMAKLRRIQSASESAKAA